MMKKFLATAFVIAGTFLTGCAAHGSYYASYGGPPPPRYAAVGVAPGPGYVWVQGFWDRSGSSWAWREGRWERPPHGHATWVPDRWQKHGKDWRLQKGHWH